MNFENLEINFKNKIIFLDIDGTLIPDGCLDFKNEVIKKIGLLKKENTIFLCTNSHDKIRSSKIADILNLPIVTGDHKKPSKKIINRLNLKDRQDKFLVIGDKILIDGFFAKNIGAQFIKVKRKISGKETIFIKLINFVDDFICWILRK